MTFSDRTRHFFHVVSNVRPIVWIALYVVLTPIFATIYWWLPDGQFRIPDSAGTDWGSWLYYSIVTITTLGFGDYTPAHGWAQTVTALEVMCGLVILGFFLNAVGSMKSEIDVASEVEKQRQAHEQMEHGKLLKSIPSIIHSLNIFLAYCYAVSTPLAKRHGNNDAEYNPQFPFCDLADMFKPSHLPIDHTSRPAVERLMGAASHLSLCLDSLQNRIDLALWPGLLENCFSFVANYQMFSADDEFMIRRPSSDADKELRSTIASQIAATTEVPGRDVLLHDKGLAPVVELYYLIKDNAALASEIEAQLTRIASASEQL